MERDLNVTETQAYQDLIDACTDTVPANAFTLKEFAHDSDLSETTARKRLQAQVEAGLLETRLATVNSFRQRVYWFKS